MLPVIEQNPAREERKGNERKAREIKKVQNNTRQERKDR